MKQKKKKKKMPDSDDDERSDSRYTKSPVGTVRDPPSPDKEFSEVNKLPIAPAIPQNQPQQLYNRLSRQDSDSAQAYGELVIKEDAYGNKSAIDEAANQENVYANASAAAVATAAQQQQQQHQDDDGPQETYGNTEVLQNQRQGEKELACFCRYFV
ncbi:hypothetical protein ElyMa_002297600 [Elysia marginata]|uniref:Uncharacterized protein n=1 Tax=Elysia marginata TaxID=1093978 RepID=A0AAV4G2W1_9GAST|nr:hypothetical protein ElyMa_002297600 [Elysia marginata]